MSIPSRISVSLCIATAAIFLHPAAASAAAIVSSTSDFEPRQNTSTFSFDPGNSLDATTLRVGFQANFAINAAFFFQLPVLAPGESIGSASFAVNVVPDSSVNALIPTFNADLVALGITNSEPPANTEAESQAYHYLGEGAFDPVPGRQLIQDNFLVPEDQIPNGGTPAVKATDSAAGVILSAHINGLYANQATNGFVPGVSYLILRLNQDSFGSSGTIRYRLASAENADAGVIQPTLNLDVVPEPAGGALALAGAIGLAARRLRRNTGS